MSDKVVKLRQEEEKFDSKDATAISFAGAVSIFVGTLGLFGVAYTGIYATEILGAMLGVAGGFQFLQIFQRTSWGKRFGSLILSALYIVSGLFIAATPVSSASAVTILLGFLFMTSGITKAIMTAEVSPKKAKFWLYTSSVLSLLLGLAIISSWPVNSVDILGFMVSLELIFTGSTFISIGSALRTEQEEVQSVTENSKTEKDDDSKKDDKSHRRAA